MGEDTDEILVKLIDYFDIKIPEDKILPISAPITVGGIQEYTWQNVANKRKEGCLSQTLYYKMRQLFNNILHLPPGIFIPSASMESLVPLKNRRKIYYEHIEKASGYKFPRLMLGRQLILVNNFICIGVFLSAAGYAFYRTQILHQSGWWWLLIILSFIIIGRIVKAFEPLRDSFNKMTVETFIKCMLVANPKLAAEKGITRAETDWFVAYTISEHAGVDLKDVTPDKRLMDDLYIS